MQAIITKYYGPTETRGTRIVARCSEDSAIVARNHAVNVEMDHARAAQKLAHKLGWYGRWFGTHLPGDRMAWVPTVGFVIDVDDNESD